MIGEPGILSALSWRQWKRAEERVRFIGGSLNTYTGDDVPAGVARYSKATEFIADDDDFETYDHIANKRLERQLTQTFLEMMGDTNMASIATGLKHPLKIERGVLVSADEGHAGVMLSQALSRSIMDDQTEYKGLRLVEWLRGYAVLQQYLRDQYIDDNPESLLIQIGKAELESLLG